jgi:hypothetical protein
MIAPVRIPENAVVLLEGMRPRAYLTTVIVAAFLVAFAVTNLLAIRRLA